MHFHFRSSSVVIFGFCEVDNEHFLLSSIGRLQTRRLQPLQHRPSWLHIELSMFVVAELMFAEVSYIGLCNSSQAFVDK